VVDRVELSGFRGVEEWTCFIAWQCDSRIVLHTFAGWRWDEEPNVSKDEDYKQGLVHAAHGSRVCVAIGVCNLSVDMVGWSGK